MQSSKIPWTDHTFNPWEGCFKVSPGCKNCYAEERDRRYHHGENWGPLSQAGRLAHSEDYWKQPLRWDRAAERSGRIARVFCGSLCDVLERDERICDNCGQATVMTFCPACDNDLKGLEPLAGLDRLREGLWTAIASTPHLMWLLLTKRPQNALEIFPRMWRTNWPRNVMFGFTAEDQKRYGERTAAALHMQTQFHTFGGRVPPIFVSVEPMLEPVRMSLSGACWDWVICGPENGKLARPFEEHWALDLMSDCDDNGVPFFYKAGPLNGTMIQELPHAWPSNVGMPEPPLKVLS